MFRILLLCVLVLGLLTSPSSAIRLSTVLETLLSAGRGQDTDLRQGTDPEPESGELWALLVAGSGGWGNYRHQADVLHAYQVLHRGGIPDDHIVVMIYDDIANNILNPHPGKVFNSPNGPDVYDGAPKDYVGTAVTAENFLSVLAGKVPSGPGSGKVIKSGPADRVFVYYADHGAPGILGMPAGPFLYGDQLVKALQAKANNGLFREMTVYIEACEAGSLFEGLMPENINVYVTTASNPRESSWGTYCPGMVPAPPSEFTTCLGDLYSVAFLENSEESDLTRETLEEQYKVVKERTSCDGTYTYGSHVMQYGSLAIDEEPVAEYLGELNTGRGPLGMVEREVVPLDGLSGTVPQRDADLLHLQVEHLRARTPARKAEALAALEGEVSRRAAINRHMRAAVARLLADPEVATTIQAKYPTHSKLSNRLWLGKSAGATEEFVSGSLPRGGGAPVVDDWDCLRAMVGAWEASCGQLDQYGMQFSRTFANLCNSGVPVPKLAASTAATCVAPVA